METAAQRCANIVLLYFVRSLSDIDLVFILTCLRPTFRKQPVRTETVETPVHHLDAGCSYACFPSSVRHYCRDILRRTWQPLQSSDFSRKKQSKPEIGADILFLNCRLSDSFLFSLLSRFLSTGVSLKTPLRTLSHTHTLAGPRRYSFSESINNPMFMACFCGGRRPHHYGRHVSGPSRTR